MRVQQGLVIDVGVKLNVRDCPTCGAIYAINEDFERRRQEDHGTFYCPAGHTIWYSGKSSTEQQLAEYQERLRLTENDLTAVRQQRERLENAVLDKAKELKALKKRVTAGMCPHCRRTFQNLARHCQTKHPEVAP